MSESGFARYDVAVAGCGLMGSAIARNFAANGLNTAAWNRTPERAEALASAGVTPIRSIAQAVSSSKLVIACMGTYGNVREALAAADLSGTTLVSVGTGTPAEAEDLQAWAVGRGARYLDGAILCYPHQIGSADGLILYSGSSATWIDHQRTLTLPGPHSALVSEDVKGASVLDVAIVGGFFSAALNAYVEGVTYALGQGVEPESLNVISGLVLHTLALSAEEAVHAVANEHCETDQATVDVYAEGARSTLGAMRDAGYRPRLLAAALDNLTEAQELGLGDSALYAIAQVARRGHADSVVRH